MKLINGKRTCFYLLNDWPRQDNGRLIRLLCILYNNFADIDVIDFHIWLLNFQFWFRIPKKPYHNDSCKKGYKEHWHKINARSQENHLLRTMIKYVPSKYTYGFSSSRGIMNPVVMCPYCHNRVAAFDFDILEICYYKHPHEPWYNRIRLDIMNWHLSYTWIGKRLA